MDHDAHSQCATPGYMHNHSSTQTPKNVVLLIASSIRRKHHQITFFLRIHILVIVQTLIEKIQFVVLVASGQDTAHV